MTPKITDKQWILNFVKVNGSILPAKLGGTIWQGKICPSEVSRRCRELRESGMLESFKKGKFERFYLKRQDPLPQPAILTQPNLFQPINNKVK